MAMTHGTAHTRPPHCQFLATRVVWNMEDARMEWKTIFHTNSILIPISCIVFIKCNGCRVVPNKIVTEGFNFNTYAHYLSTNRGTLVVYIARRTGALHHGTYIAICSTDVIVDDLGLFLYFEIDNLPSRSFFLCYRHENSY